MGKNFEIQAPGKQLALCFHNGIATLHEMTEYRGLDNCSYRDSNRLGFLHSGARLSELLY